MPESLETQTLIEELRSKYGIYIDDSDPAIAIVALNQLFLVRTTEQISERIRLEVKELEEGASRVQRRLGQSVAEEFNDHLSALRKSLQDDITLAGGKTNEFIYRIEQANGYPVMVRWTAIGFICALLMFAFGVVLGWGYLPHWHQ